MARNTASVYTSPVPALGAAIDMDNARAALARVTSDMRTGQMKIVAHELRQQRPRINIRRNRNTINCHRNIGHKPLLHHRASARFLNHRACARFLRRPSSEAAPDRILTSGTPVR